MYLIASDRTNSFFNLAVEEYLLKNHNDEFIFLYRNAPSVIVGKHQNAQAEINHQLVCNNNIQVSRRISGGGTVYHDLGNVNFTFIKNGIAGKLVDFENYLQPVIKFLKSKGLDAKFGGHNSLLIDNHKVSGNAEHLWKNRIIHHGTLLYDCDLTILKQVLNLKREYFHDKAIHSVSAQVTNIKQLLEKRISTENFLADLKRFFLTDYQDCSLSAKDELNINCLVDEKYSKDEWNYGYSPDYKFEKTDFLSNKKAHISLTVEHGIMVNVNIKTDIFSKIELQSIENELLGKYHLPASFNGLKKMMNNKKIFDEFIWLFF